MKTSLKHILITGSDGQLGQCFASISKDFQQVFQFHFKNRKELDITNAKEVELLFSKQNFSVCINCAAYTSVDKAEGEPEKAFSINAEGVKNLAISCKRHDTILLQVSTDYVFDGKKNSPYTERDIAIPLNIYGQSKLKGEQYITSILDSYFIIRTSWLFSEYGNNFVKTMTSLLSSKEKINVVSDQYGSPTYARDLAKSILFIIEQNSESYGIYHYSNLDNTTWYNFAKEVKSLTGHKAILIPVEAKSFNMRAIRPKYSVLDTTKYEKLINKKSRPWQLALQDMLSGG